MVMTMLRLLKMLMLALLFVPATDCHPSSAHASLFSMNIQHYWAEQDKSYEGPVLARSMHSSSQLPHWGMHFSSGIYLSEISKGCSCNLQRWGP